MPPLTLPPLTVIATSDLHGTLPTQLGTHVRAPPGPVLWVDNGDLFGGPSGLQFSLGGGDCAMVQALNRLGLAALNVGNHDLDQGVDGLLERARQADFPILSANLYDGVQRLLPDCTEVDTPAGRVGITGAITPVAWHMWPPWMRERLRLTDPVAALTKSCAALRDRCKYVIALAHLGYPIGPEPAAENPGEALVAALTRDAGHGRPLADCVVLGHTHVAHASVQGRTAVLLPPSGGQGFGRAVLSDGPTSVEQIMVEPEADSTTQLSARVTSLLDHPLPTDATTLGEQLLAAARTQDADGVVITRRAEPQGPPVRTLGEALTRMPLLEPLVLLELDAAGLAQVLETRDRHLVLAETAADAAVARRHLWHGFELLTDRRSGSPDPTLRLLVPASWSGGYAGYDPFSQARLLAQPGLHLLQLLLVALRNGDKQRGRRRKEHPEDGTRR